MHTRADDFVNIHDRRVLLFFTADVLNRFLKFRLEQLPVVFIGLLGTFVWFEAETAVTGKSPLAGSAAGEDCRTNAEGIFTAGDCRTKQVRQSATAISDGAVAAVAACRYLD